MFSGGHAARVAAWMIAWRSAVDDPDRASGTAIWDLLRPHADQVARILGSQPTGSSR